MKKKLKIKGKETKDPEEKDISSSQGIPSSFDWGEEGCSSLSTPFFFVFIHLINPCLDHFLKCVIVVVSIRCNRVLCLRYNYLMIQYVYTSS